MNNSNALVALAYIKSSDNPLKVFCNYILYILLSAPDKQLRVDELHDKTYEKFGLDMPQQMINVCTRILRKNHDIEVLPNGAGYLAINTNFSVEEFNKNLLRLHEQEDCVLSNMVDFMATRYKQIWTPENAKEYLSTFLDKQGNGASLFMHEVLEPATTASLSPSWYIGRYVDYLSQDKSSLEWSYLIEIINGMMIYQGVYQTNDYEQDKKQKFKDTRFYFDTKLVLRAMGYSWGAQVQATKELIQLISKEYGGQIFVFEQTICEVENALSYAGSAYDKGNEIYDMELRAYATLDPVGASLLSERSGTVRAWLENDPSFNISEDLDWNLPQNQMYDIDVTGLTEHIKQQHQDWRPGTINNDVAVINQINILRKGDYTQRYGGKKKLPVFITTNIDLVYSVRDYAQNQAEIGGRTKWNPHALPAISDNMILFRLWVPVAGKYSNLPSITLSRYAYCAQNTDSQFFEALRKKAVEYKAVNGVDLINLSDARRKKLEDIIISKTDGDPENISEPILATSVEELIKFENSSLRNELGRSKETGEVKDQTIKSQEIQIIELAASPCYDKLKMLRCIIWAAKWWWIMAAIILFFVSDRVTGLTSFNNNFVKYVIGALPLMFELIAFIFGKYLSNEKLEYFLLKPAIMYVVTRFSDKIRNHIRPDELKYTDNIILDCLNHTPLLKKYERFWPEAIKIIDPEEISKVCIEG